jgi:hypothetical protein
MQSNFSTIKTMRKPKQQEASEKAIKTAYKGRTWERGTDKREMYNYCLQGALK